MRITRPWPRRALPRDLYLRWRRRGGLARIAHLGISTSRRPHRIRRITDVCASPLVGRDTGFGASAFNVARTVKSLIKFGAGAMHIEDQVGAKRCGTARARTGLAAGDVERIKAAVDARTDPGFFIIARTDALRAKAREGVQRAVACVEAAPTESSRAITDLAMYKRFKTR